MGRGRKVGEAKSAHANAKMQAGIAHAQLGETMRTWQAGCLKEFGRKTPTISLLHTPGLIGKRGSGSGVCVCVCVCVCV